MLSAPGGWNASLPSRGWGWIFLSPAHGDDLLWVPDRWQSLPQPRSKARDPHQLRVNGYRVVLSQARTFPVSGWFVHPSHARRCVCAQTTSSAIRPLPLARSNRGVQVGCCGGCLLSALPTRGSGLFRLRGRCAPEMRAVVRVEVPLKTTSKLKMLVPA